jgi:hypothetical protein
MQISQAAPILICPDLSIQEQENFMATTQILISILAVIAVRIAARKNQTK